MKKSLIGAIVFLFWCSGVALGAPCPECPEGCVPLAGVAALRPEPIGVVAECPNGCIAIANVKAIYEKPLCEQVTATTTSPPVPTPSSPPTPLPEQSRQSPPAQVPAESTISTKPEKAQPPVTPQPEPQKAITEPEPEIEEENSLYNLRGKNRMILSRTAFGQNKGDTEIFGYGLAVWSLDYGLSDNLELNVKALLPVVMYGFSVGPMVHTELVKNMEIGAGIECGVAGLMLSTSLGWGCNPKAMYSIQIRDDHIVNVAWQMALGGSATLDYGPNPLGEMMFMFPAIGYQVAFKQTWSFQTEFVLPIGLTKKHDDTMYSEKRRNLNEWFVLWMYGFRVHGELLFGDFGFVLPMGEWYVKEMMQYCPLGFPYFMLGFHF